MPARAGRPCTAIRIFSKEATLSPTILYFKFNGADFVNFAPQKIFEALIKKAVKGSFICEIRTRTYEMNALRGITGRFLNLLR
jgi:hypothetical protein